MHSVSGKVTLIEELLNIWWDCSIFFETKVIQIVIYLNQITPYLSILYSFTHNFMFIHTYRYIRTFENILRERHNLPVRYRMVLVLKNQKNSFFSIFMIFCRTGIKPMSIDRAHRYTKSDLVFLLTYIFLKFQL